MENFYLEKPSLKRKEEIIEYLKELDTYNSDINGIEMLYKIYEGYPFDEVLNNCLKRENEEYSKKINKCAIKTFLLIRKKDNRIIGAINIRWNLPESMKKFSGNIGYGIRPTERRKGYNKINLYLGLIEAKKVGLEKIMLVCSSDNIGSNKTLLALGGILVREEIDPSDGELTKIYHFDVDDCIKNYREVYKNIITNSEDKMKKSI